MAVWVGNQLVPRPGVVARVPCLRKSTLLVYLDKVSREVRARGGRRDPLTCTLLIWSTMDHVRDVYAGGDTVWSPLCPEGWPGRGPAVTQGGGVALDRARICSGVQLMGLAVVGRRGVERGGKAESEIRWLQKLARS